MPNRMVEATRQSLGETDGTFTMRAPTGSKTAVTTNATLNPKKKKKAGDEEMSANVPGLIRSYSFASIGLEGVK